MFIAMNRFRVKKGSEEAFEQVWLSRDTQLTKVPGFVEFHLLKGPEHEDYTLYSSHTAWQRKATFEAWTKSEAFRLAHRDAGQNKPLYLDRPQFEGFEVRQTVRCGNDAVALSSGSKLLNMHGGKSWMIAAQIGRAHPVTCSVAGSITAGVPQHWRFRVRAALK